MTDRSLLPMFKRLGLLLVLAIAISPTLTWAALSAYMRLTGETQGEIKGGVTQAGREDSIEVVGFGHNVSQVLDAVTSQPTGKRQHRPIRIVKEVDKSTPILFTVLTTNENLTDVTIRFWRPAASGQEVQYYTIELLNARIASIMPRHSSLALNKDELTTLPLLETVTFVYEKIVVTWEDGGITGEDDWLTPPVP